jgi:hypothetical protein
MVIKKDSLCGIAVSSWLQIQRSGFNSRHYQIFWEVVGLEWGPLSLVSTKEVLFERKSSGSSLESREHRDPSCWPHGTLYSPKLTLTSLTSGGCSVSIVCSRTQTTEFSLEVLVFMVIKRPAYLWFPKYSIELNAEV